MIEPRAAARVLAGYAKRHHAGAFAMPTAKELARHPQSLRVWGDGAAVTVAVTKRLTRDSIRRDWTGRSYLLPAGTLVVTHLGRTERGPVPDLDEFDTVFAYVEDADLAAGLIAQGREPRAVRVSASSELIWAWGRAGERWTYDRHDLVTVAEVPGPADGWTGWWCDELRDAALAEVAGVDGWHDDYPFYSDGSWSALSLRGFRRDDPTWGVKPAEMSKAWKAEHPEAAGYECEWTVLADVCPTLVSIVRAVEWWGELERVRLLRMEGRGGRGGKLSRHTDITDQAAGLADGQVARFHLPLVTHPSIVMHTWELNGTERVTHLAPWRLWYLDARKPHAVTNPTGVDRIHLVADVIVDARVREQIAAAA